MCVFKGLVFFFPHLKMKSSYNKFIEFYCCRLIGVSISTSQRNSLIFLEL